MQQRFALFQTNMTKQSIRDEKGRHHLPFSRLRIEDFISKITRVKIKNKIFTLKEECNFIRLPLISVRQEGIQ